MMRAEGHSVSHLLRQLQDKNIRITLDGDELDIKAPRGTLTPELIAELKARKPELTNWFRANAVQTPLTAHHWQPGDRLPATTAQESMWLSTQMQPDLPINTVWTPRVLRGDINTDALQKSLDYLIERHKSLRTTFEMDMDTVMQVIHEPYSVPIELIPCPDNATLNRILRDYVHKPFDLENGPLLRVPLFQIAPDQHVLVLIIDHLITDGWSQDIIWRDWDTSYQAFCKGETPELPALPIDYADFSHWQTTHITGDVLQQHIDYWQAELKDVPPTLNLPFDHPRPTVPTGRGAEFFEQFDTEMTELVNAFSRGNNLTPFAVLMASFALLVGRYSRQSDFLMGTPVSGRSQPETENVIGLFSILTALRVRLKGSFIDLVREIRDSVYDVVDYSNFPLEQYMRTRPQSHDRLAVQAVFLLQKSLHNEDNFFGELYHSIELDRIATTFDILAAVRPNPDGMQIRIEYSTDLFETNTIARMVEHWKILLHAALTHPEQPMLELPLLSESERNRIVHEWNDTTTAYPRDRTIDSLFEECVNKPPTPLPLLNVTTT